LSEFEQVKEMRIQSQDSIKMFNRVWL